MPPWWRLDTVRFAAEVAVAAVSERDEAAGLHGGDVVVEVDGAEVGSDADEVARLLAGATERRLVVKRAPTKPGWEKGFGF